MNAVSRFLIVAAMLLMAGCATGPKFSEMQSKIGPLAAGQGRVYVYRDSAFGAAITPNVTINGKVVGVSRANGFFYTDLPAGNYRLAAETEVERSITFTLAAGESKYVKASMSFGIVAGRINFDLVNQAAGHQDLQSLAYSPEL
jgi:uncharacterized lipoprotein YajG